MPRHVRLGYAGALLLLALVLCAGHLDFLRGTAVPIWDADGFYAPAQILVADHARQGKVLLWNPWMSGGRPDCADPQVGAFSPINVGFGLLTGATLSGFLFYWLVTWWLGSVGVLFLARHFDVPAWGGAIAALAYMASGFHLNNAQHTTFVLGMSFLPWIVWRFDDALIGDRAWSAVQAGVLWGLLALAGYPGMVILTAFYLGLWTLGRVLICSASTEPGRAPRRTVMRRRLSRSAIAWGLFLTLGCVVLAPTYVTFFAEGAGYSDRVESLSRERAIGSNALHPGATATFASPYLALSKMIDRSLWDYTDPSMTNIYVGLVALALAIAAVVLNPRSPWRWWILGMGLLCLAAAMGRVLPVRGWLYDLLPPMRFFRHAAIFRGFYIFSMVVLALLAARDLALERRPPRASWLRLAAVGLVLGVPMTLAVRLVVAKVAETGADFQLAIRWTTALWLGIWLLALVAALAPSARRDWAIPLLLTLLAGGDAWMSLHLNRGFRMSYNTRAWKSATAHYTPNLNLTAHGFKRPPRPPSEHGRNNHNLLSKTPVLESYDPFRHPHLMRWINIPELHGLALGTERTWFAPRAARLPATHEAFFAFEYLAQERGGMVPLVVETSQSSEPVRTREDRHAAIAQFQRQLAGVPAAERLPVELDIYWPNRLDFAVDAPDDGWVLVTDRYAAGWRAWVDGEETPIHRGDFVFRAVEIRRGRHQISFRYRPLGYPSLLVVSWGTIGIVVCISLLRRIPWALRFARRSRIET